MKKYIIPIILAILIISLFIRWGNNGTFDKFVDKIKTTVEQNLTLNIKETKDEIKNITITKKEDIKEKYIEGKNLKQSCLKDINRNIEILEGKMSSNFKAELLEYEIFSDREEAIEYVEMWNSETINGQDTKIVALDDFKNIENFENVFVWIFKGDMGEMSGAFGDALIQGRVAYTVPIVCVDGKLMLESIKPFR